MLFFARSYKYLGFSSSSTPMRAKLTVLLLLTAHIWAVPVPSLPEQPPIEPPGAFNNVAEEVLPTHNQHLYPPAQPPTPGSFNPTVPESTRPSPTVQSRTKEYTIGGLCCLGLLLVGGIATGSEFCHKDPKCRHLGKQWK
jgi:hypothetical protein